MADANLFAENVVPFLVILSDRVGYAFDEADETAIRHGLTGTDPNEGRWFEYPLVGAKTVTVRLAQEPGQSVVQVAVSLPGDETYVTALFDVMQAYVVGRERAPYERRWTV